MSLEEDTELRDLVTQTLEANGSLAKIRAQLRASMFLALDDDELTQKQQPMLNTKIKNYLETTDGQIMFCLVREFLEFFDLDFTMSVYEPESYMGSKYHYEGRSSIIATLGLPLEETSPIPLLLQLIEIAKMNNDVIKSKEVNIKSEENIIDDLDTLEGSISLTSKTIDPCEDLKPDERVLMDQTFDVRSPNICIDVNKPRHIRQSKLSLKSGESSRPESSDKQNDGISIDLDMYDRSCNTTEYEKSSVLDCDNSPPVVKDTKHPIPFEKVKSPSQKNDKLKSKSNIASMGELPPLQTNKPRNDMLLPSLYTKEFKDKNNLRDIEKIFDLESLDNYEEDFMSESEIDMLINKTDTKPHSPEQNSVSNSCPKRSVNGADVSWQQCKLDDADTSAKFDSLVSLGRERINSTSSSVTREDFLMNATVDEILNSS